MATEPTPIPTLNPSAPAAINSLACFGRTILPAITSILGYFDDKQEHKNVIFKYFNNKDLNWYWHPKSEVVNEFIATPFDILISLHLKPCPPLEYISSTSQAHLRVGRYHPQKEHCYDLMIDVADEYDLKGFSEQVESMLKRVNN